MINSVQLL